MRSCVRVLPAFWLVTGGYGLFLYARGKIAFHDILRTMSTLAFWTGRNDYFNWYIPALLMFYLCTPFCYKLFKRVKHRIFLVAVCFVAVVAFTDTLNRYRTDLAGFVYRMPVFLLGIVIGLYCTEERSLPLPELSLWGLGLIAAPVFNNLFAQRTWFLPSQYLFVLYVVFICLFASRLILILPNTIRSLLRLVGSSSLEIYLLNVVFVLVHGDLTSLMNMDTHQLSYYILAIPANIALGIGFHKLLEPFIKYMHCKLCLISTQ